MEDEHPTVNDWNEEANGIIQDVKNHVNEIRVSSILPSTISSIFLNLTILEGRRMCVKVSSLGFEVVGEDYDRNDILADCEHIYETPYALLSQISPKFIQSFGNKLISALNSLPNSEAQEPN